MLPKNTSQVLSFLFPAATFSDWEARDDGKSVAISRWSLAQPQPSEAEIVAAAGSAEFAAWLDTRTDPVKRLRGSAKFLMAASNEPIFVALRVAFKKLGASLREVRQAQGKPVRNDQQFMADIFSGIDAGEGEV